MASKNFILYADDDAEDRDMVEEMFASYGDYTLITFSDAQHLLQHLEALKKEDVSLIILDINMPFLTGLEALLVIRKHNDLADLPVVIYTTSNSPADKAAAEGLKARVMIKPVSYKELEGIVGDMIDYCGG